ncbi:MAG: hypothetical protein NTU89_01375 [Candidatus Dependentiae bacterium]|nr:hypothetical protein [Candidatus Dependentiae bacterium]
MTTVQNQILFVLLMATGGASVKERLKNQPCDSLSVQSSSLQKNL